MLSRVTLPGSTTLSLSQGLQVIRPEDGPIAPGVGFALFDAGTRGLPKVGSVEVELVGSLDGRGYRVRRAVDAPENWQVFDHDTSWLAASGVADVQHWLRTNLDIPEDRPLAALFRETVSFSIPASLAWLLEDSGLRERKLACLLSLDRYPIGLRWLDSVVSEARAATHELECGVSEAQGQDALFTEIERRLELARAGELAVSDSAIQLRQQLGAAKSEAEQLATLQTELAEVQHQLLTRRVQLAASERQLEVLQRWWQVHQRAQQAVDEHRVAWQEYEQAEVEIGKLTAQLAGVGAVQAEYLAVQVEVLATEREQGLLQTQMGLVQSAESAAADLAQSVQAQQQLEQQVTASHERAMRLEIVGRALQSAAADAKRVEVLLADAEKELSELEQLGPQAARAKKLADELERQRQQLRDVHRQVDQLRFYEGAIRAVSGYAEDLRKSASMTERLVAQDGGNGAVKTDERTVASHLRQAVDQQLLALEGQVQEWRAQARELAAAPQKIDQLRSSMHQLEQELEGVSRVQIKLGAIPALKQQRKQLHEHFGQLTKSVDGYAKEQRECAVAAAQGAQLRQELGKLGDPRAERQALLRQAAHKKGLEQELRETGKRLDERRKQQSKLEEQLAALADLQRALEAQEQLRRQAAASHREYLIQQAIAALTESTEEEVATVSADVEHLRQEIDQAEARVSSLNSSSAALHGAPERVATLHGQLGEADLRSLDWAQQRQQAEQAFGVAEQNRETLRQRRQQVELHTRAERLLVAARETVRRAEVQLGTYIRQELATRASACLQCLVDRTDISIAWSWADPPAVVTAEGTLGLAELAPVDQAYAVLAVRLALATDASRVGAVLVSGLGSLIQASDFAGRVRGLPEVEQLIALPSI